LLNTLRELINEGKFVVEAESGGQTYETLVRYVGVDVDGNLVAIVRAEGSSDDADDIRQ